jgi:peptide/nickel transport system ATP-binding protein/oligopeptide transport system ATP-binding protein
LSAIPVPSPGAHRDRRILQGDVPSPIAPPPGCHLHPRCPHSVDRCRTERPALADDAAGHATACHRWRELPDAAHLVPREAVTSRTLEKLQAAFVAAAG